MRRLFGILILAAVALAVPAQSIAAERSPLWAQLPGSRLLSHMESDLPGSRNFRSQFQVEASGGYKVQVLTFGSAVILVVTKGRIGKRFIGTAYLARGVAAPERLQATFGRFGRVSMRFREARNRPWFGKRRDCRGRSRFVRRRGVFVGNLRFKGEGGYLSLRIHRAKGTIVRVARKCLGQRRPLLPFAESSSHLTGLLALARDGVDSTAFFTIQGKRTISFASHEEVRGRLAISRIAIGRSRAPLRINEAATAATISPPAPFHGAGRYRAAPDGTATWSGSLSVNFPGAPRFPLTGPDFKTLLEAGF